MSRHQPVEPSPPSRAPFGAPPAPGAAVEVASGLLWMRLPLPMALDHVNVYALDDGTRGWTVVDTGAENPGSRAIWEQLLAGPLQRRPVWRVIVTHYHPDHAGLAAWLCARGAELWCSRVTWLLLRALVLDVATTHPPHVLQFWRDCGLSGALLQAKLANPPFNMAALAGLPPPQFRRLREDEVIVAGGRRWRVRLDEGHAPEQVTLWDEAGALVLAADQILPMISPNISVSPVEPDADPLGDWLTSCARLQAFAGRQLVLPGHKLPFTGPGPRLQQMVEHHHQALARLQTHLAQPRVAADCFSPLFNRKVTPLLVGFALGETVAHLNYLLRRGLVRRHRRADGAWLWEAVAPGGHFATQGTQPPAPGANQT